MRQNPAHSPSTAWAWEWFEKRPFWVTPASASRPLKWRDFTEKGSADTAQRPEALS